MRLSFSATLLAVPLLLSAGLALAQDGPPGRLPQNRPMPGVTAVAPPGTRGLPGMPGGAPGLNQPAPGTDKDKTLQIEIPNADTLTMADLKGKLIATPDLAIDYQVRMRELDLLGQINQKYNDLGGR